MIMRWCAAFTLLGCIGPAFVQAQTAPRHLALDPAKVPLLPVPAVVSEGLPRAERLTNFDSLGVRLQRQDDHWTILAGDLVLKDCGRREEDARFVWRLIGQMGLNQHG